MRVESPCPTRGAYRGRSSRGARSPARELTCLLCGEFAGVLENGRVVRPRIPGSVRYDGRRLACRRCGSALIPGEEDC